MASSSRRSSRAILLLAALSLFTLTGFGCRRPGGASDALDQPLVVWGLWQESAQMQPIIDAFETQTGVKVEYKKIASVATYEQELLNALVEGRGPDIFVIHHTWVEGKRGRMSPAPPEIIDERALRDEFVNVVADDVVRDGFIYALPTSVDTLALYVNEDIFAANAIPAPPATWSDFQQRVAQITRVTRTGDIQQSAVALGTAANVNRASDIVQLLMLQQNYLHYAENAIMTDGSPELVSELNERALTVYTDFSNKSKKVYTWDVSQDFSIDAFAEGDTAMMINYSYHIPTIRAKNPRLRFTIAPLPQITAAEQVKRNFASYWPFAVSNTSRAPITAWQFVRFLTSSPVSDELNRLQVAPPAQKASIATFSRDPNVGVFADQALSAISWPRVDILATDGIFNRMIDDVKKGTPIPDALRSASDQLKQLHQTSNAG